MDNRALVQGAEVGGKGVAERKSVFAFLDTPIVMASLACFILLFGEGILSASFLGG